MDIQRKAFESSNNVNPDWSFKFDEELQQYIALDSEMELQVDEFNEHWDTFRAGWQAAKAQAVPEWVNFEFEKPKDGQKCLVVFESGDCEDAQRWMSIDEFNEGMFDFIANWEDQCASVALPAGSIISKVRAVCWAKTNLSNAPLSFDQFYKTQEPAND